MDLKLKGRKAIVTGATRGIGLRIARQLSDEVWVVAREGQAVATDAPVARDPAEGLGPLAGIAAGLRAVRAERAFVTACDAPLLEPRFAEALHRLSLGRAGAIPRSEGHLVPTSAVYTTALAPVAEALLAAGRRRPRDLVERADLRVVEAAELRTVDPELHSLFDCDTPEAYREALRLAGL